MPGVDAVEHGGEEGAPGGFAPLVGGREDIQPAPKGQCFAVEQTISLCPASFCTPRPNLPISPVIS